MDGNRFDDLSRTLATEVSRRGAVKGIVAGLLAALGLRSAADAQQVTQATAATSFAPPTRESASPGASAASSPTATAAACPRATAPVPSPRRPRRPPLRQRLRRGRPNHHDLDPVERRPPPRLLPGADDDYHDDDDLRARRQPPPPRPRQRPQQRHQPPRPTTTAAPTTTTTTQPSQCIANSDCDDGNPCTLDRCRDLGGGPCDAGDICICVFPPRDAGAQAGGCTGANACDGAGNCVATTTAAPTTTTTAPPVQCTVNGDCGDGNPCTFDRCQDLSGGNCQTGETCFCAFPPRDAGFQGGNCSGASACDGAGNCVAHYHDDWRDHHHGGAHDLHDHDCMSHRAVQRQLLPARPDLLRNLLHQPGRRDVQHPTTWDLRSRDHPVPEQFARLRPEPAAANGDLQRPRRQLRRGGRRRLRLLHRRQPLRRLQHGVPVPQRHASLRLGTCVIATCDPGWSDCDEVSSNGCEANTTTAFEHCGGCGNVCDNEEQCVDSVCQPMG